MQATIYVTQEAFDTANAIKDLDYFDRMSLSDDEETDMSGKPGYYLKNPNKLRLAVLPHSAKIGVCLSPDNSALYQRHVTIPTNLRGCIFEKAPHLPEGYADIVAYWSGEPLNTNTSGAAYFQNPLNEYMVDLSAIGETESGSEAVVASVAVDRMLSEGVVVCISGVESLISALSLHHYVEIKVPVNQNMLGVEPDDFRSTNRYETNCRQQCERVFIRVADIICSPDRNRLIIDLIRHELVDYGFFY